MNVLVSRILSGLPSNEINVTKAYNYGMEMAENDREFGETGFPPILGYWGVAEGEHLGLTTGLFVKSDETDYVITREDIGKFFFFVTDGHHRVMGAKMHGVGMLQYELDQTGFCGHNKK